MKPRIILMIVMVAALAAAPIPFAEAEAETESETKTEADADSGLVPCLAADANSEPIWPTNTFPASGKQMVCIFRLGEEESFEKLTSKWIAVDVGDAAPANTVIGEHDLPLQGRKGGKLRYVLPRPLPVGTYRLEVLADGEPWKSVEMMVEADEKPIEIDSPDALIPLTEGKTWTYDFVQEAGPAAKLSIPKEQLDPDGKFRATVTLTVGKTDKTGTEVLVKRNDETVTQEWWTLDDKGLFATQRKADGDLIRLDPPQPLLPLVGETYHAWKYAPKDGSFTQEGQLWAGLEIKSSSGKKLGFLTVVEQATPLGKITVERHFMPGVGMTRETVTSSLGPKLLSRQTMTLVAPEKQ